MAFESDWLFLREALPDLRDYILSSDVYRPLRSSAPGGNQLPQLTIGSLALSLTRLAALDLTGRPAAELAEITRAIDSVRQEWRSNWEIKAGREFQSRINLWQQYVRELRADPRRSAAGYASEVRTRAILRLLRPEAGDLPAGLEEHLGALDQMLRGLTQPGPFVWEPELAGGFSRNDFWFLYVVLPGQAGSS